jgi:light-regulated signal transduction histidine kinase (bacteriophytochrome)
VKDRKHIVKELICPVTNRWLRLSISYYSEGIICLFHDIHEQKEAEAEKQALGGELKRKNRELASLNTELRTLNSVIANNYSERFAQLYISIEHIINTEAAKLSNSGRANLRRSQSAIQIMKLLTHDIHHYLELYEYDMKPELVDTTEIIHQVLNKLIPKIKEANAKIHVDDLPQMLVDPELFSRLIYNLLDNAIKFRKADTEPEIRINYSIVDQSQYIKDGKTPGSYCTINIHDNGIGFEFSERIFGLFTQLHEHGKYRSASMGLPICKKIMEMHGGFIAAESEPDKGALFTCYFPLDGH